VIYIRETFLDLIRTFWSLSDENTTIILSQEIRRLGELEFVRMMKQFFVIESVSIPQSQLSFSLGRPLLIPLLSQIPDEELDEQFRSDDIGVFSIRKRPEVSPP
jgi:hypothetical protein